MHPRRFRSLPAFRWIGGALLACGTLGANGLANPAEAGQLLVPHPDPDIGSNTFVPDAHQAGRGRSVGIEGVYWGRLVDVADATGRIQNRDCVVGEDIRDGSSFLASDGTTVTFQLKTSPFTARTRVLLDAPAESRAYGEAFRRLDANLTAIEACGLDPAESGPFSMAPRNAAIVVCFDDLLDPRFDGGAWLDSFGGESIDSSSGQLAEQLIGVGVGYPPAEPFRARVILDRNHGGLADFDRDRVSEFHSTRVILDPTVSELEAEHSNPPLAIHPTGLPASEVLTAPNVVLRIPTRRDPSTGQLQILANPSGRPVSFSGNGPTDPHSTTGDVVRSLRSGGSDGVRDTNNGFLSDLISPEVIGKQEVGLRTVPTEVSPGFFNIAKASFKLTACAVAPEVGDVLMQGAVVAEVVSSGGLNGAVVDNLLVQVLHPVGGLVTLGRAELRVTFDPATDHPPCFVTFTPEATTPPGQAVSNLSSVAVCFSEAMDWETIRTFEELTVTSVSSNPTGFDFVVGQVNTDRALQEFSFDHEVPFAHAQGSAETYYLNLASGPDGPLDLAGNVLAAALPQVSFQLDPSEATELSGGVALRFENADELFGDAFPELRDTQIIRDLAEGRIVPRPVSRFSTAADTNQPVPSVMTPFVGGVQTPISPLGSKLHTVWRYCDVGFSLTDEANQNVDIEGLSWAPSGGSVINDAYDEFSITLAHSKHLPDELLASSTGFPKWPFSGLGTTYAANYLDSINDPGEIVHPRERGYTVNPAELYVASSSTIMLPYPMNRNLPADQHRHYTWRDTALQAVGGPNGNGAPPDQEMAVLGLPPSAKLYSSGVVPTIGLPLLMEFRCYPDSNGLGLNGFSIALACNSSARPNFRAYSTGGYNVNGSPVIKNPDLEDVADGGFNPNSTPPGATTMPVDCVFYLGEMALVTRVSRTHTVWFDTTLADPTYLRPVLEPHGGERPAGTNVVVAYRGATAIGNIDGSNPPNDIRRNAGLLDPYGEKDPATHGTSYPVFLNSDSSWKDDLAQVSSARYFQARITFIGNAATNETADLRSIGFAWQQQ